MGREKEKQHFFDPVGPFLDRQSHLQEKVRFSARQNLSFSQRLLMELPYSQKNKIRHLQTIELRTLSNLCFSKRVIGTLL